MRPQQLYIAGTEPPPETPRDPEIDERIDAWLAAKREQAKAAEATKIRQQSLDAELVERGIERYPYTDDKGEKRYYESEKRFRSVKAPRKRETAGDRVDAADEALDELNAALDQRVESRRVSRASVEAEIDPFAATREKMAGGESIDVEHTEDATGSVTTFRASKKKPPAPRGAKRGGKGK